MREWLQSLDQRERILVSVAAGVVAVFLFWMLVWQPLSRGQERLQSEIGELRDLTVLVGQAAATARAAGGQGASVVRNTNRSLLSLVDETTKQRGLKDAVKRIQPEGDTTVRVWLEGAAFDDVVRWLHELGSRHGIALSNGNLDRDDNPGTVKARLTLQRNS